MNKKKKKDSSNGFFKPPHGKAYRGIKGAGVYLRLPSRQIKTYVEHFLLQKQNTSIIYTVGLQLTEKCFVTHGLIAT